ncbi:MAG: hypothetical protein ABIR70_20250 [Bryobacteraceae bacterium]
MKKTLLLAFTSVGLFAQAPAPSPEMQQVLDLLKTLQAKVDQQQRRIEQLEGRTPVVAAAAKPPAVAPPSEATALQLKVGDTSITPVGFMDLTNTFRSTNAGTSLQSNFASIPYNNTVAGRLTEDKLTVANSRIGFRVDTKVKGLNVLGYYEGDFVGGIGNAAFNTQVTSNSLLYRVRLFWVDLRKNRWEMLAGQSWSMMVPNRRQISALPADLFYAQVVDANYLNGLPWGRTPGARLLYHPSEKLTFAVGVENSTQYFGGSGGAGVPVLPTALAPLIGGELDQSAANGIATPNVRPDILAKVAWDPSPRMHLEVTGVSSAVRLFNPITGQKFTKSGAGGSVNGNVELVRNLRLFSNNFWGDGEGRYLFGVAPDFVVRANGSPSMIHAGSTVSGLEYQRGNSLWYAYYGGIYVGRNTTLDSDGTSPVGYGFAGSPLSHNRTTQESTAGVTQTFWRDGKFGAMQAMVQYAYLMRNPWSVDPGMPKGAHEHVAYFNLRFTLPGAPPRVTR